MLMDEIKKRAEKPMQPEPSLEESFVEPALEPEPVKTMLDFNGKRIRRVKDLLSKSPPVVAGCSNCPACGTWDHAEFKGKQVCFYTAYYVGKSGRPVVCDIAKVNCPKIKKNGGKGKEEPRVSHVVSHVSTQ